VTSTYLNIKDLTVNFPKVNGVEYSTFVVHHAFYIEGGDFAGLSASKCVGIKAMLEAQAINGFAFTCHLNGQPVACFGCTKLWDGVGEMWSVIGDIARTKPVAMTKVGIAFVDICQISLGLHRLQITVKTSNNSAVKWARAIGFISECVMKRYSADKLDYNLMVRLVDDND
jgi:hypothetical protein